MKTATKTTLLNKALHRFIAAALVAVRMSETDATTKNSPTRATTEPEGFKTISRWSSEAIPPVTRAQSR